MHQETTVRGLLQAIDWDSRDRVVRVALLTADEDEFELELGENARALLGHQRREVVVRGVLRRDLSRRKILAVSSFEVVPEA